MSRQKVTTSRDMVDILLHYTKSLGIDVERLKTETGFSAFETRNGMDRIPIGKTNLLWQEAVQLSGDPAFGLHLGEAAQKMTSGGIILSVMMNCATLENALQKLIRYHDLATDFVQLHLRLEGDFAYFSWETTDTSILPDRHHTDIVFCGLISHLRRLMHDTVKPLAMHFKYARPADVSEHERILGCDLVFDHPRNELVLYREDLAKPIFLANPALLNKLEQLAQEMLEQIYPPDSWAERVSRLINERLWRGEKPALPALASELALSSRQLQNKLAREGYTFQSLLDQVRKDIAVSCLNDPRTPICDIAFLLGYTEQSTFNHTFKRWTGSTPGEYRSCLRR